MARDLVQDALRRMRELNSVRIDCSRSRSGESEDEPGTKRFTLIIVGEDYHQSGDIDSGGEAAEAVRAILGEPNECLHYVGVEYVRDPRHGDWLKILPDARRNTVVLSDMATLVLDEAGLDVVSGEEYRRQHLVLGAEPGRMQEYSEVARQGLGGLSLLYIHCQFAEPVRRGGVPSIEELEKTMSMPPETRANLVEALSKIPDTVRGTLDLWIDEESRLVHRLESIDEGLRDERVMHRFEETRLYSLFDEAELPGPLPDSSSP